MITTQENPTVWLNVTDPRLALNPAHTNPPGATEWITTDPAEVLDATGKVIEAREALTGPGRQARRQVQGLVLKLPSGALNTAERRATVADYARRGPRVNVHVEVYDDYPQ